MAEVVIGGRHIGANHPTYIIAELSANHHHDYSQAVALIEAAHAAGADAIKLQTYTPDTLTIPCDNAHFRIGHGTLWEGQTLYDLYGEAYTPWEWQPRLKAVAEDLGMDLFSTPFDDSAVDFLEGMRVPAYKIASFEMVDLALIRRVAQTGKPIILSTGMASTDEIQDAVTAARAAGNTQLVLLKCTSAYPALASAMHLRTIPDLAARFGTVVGLSDHTMNLEVPVAAVALGARVIEKHFTLSRAVSGPDSPFSLEPAEFRAMVQAVRVTEQALGAVQYGAQDHEAASRAFRRSLFVVADVEDGEMLTAKNVRSIRPGYGLACKHLPEVLGCRAAKKIARGTPLTWDLVAK